MGHTCVKLKSHLQQANEEDDYDSGKPVYVVCLFFFENALKFEC